MFLSSIINLPFFNNTTFALTPEIVWSFSYFYLTLYLVSVFFALLYLLANTNDFLASDRFKSLNSFSYLPASDLTILLFTPLFLLSLVNYTWTSSLVIAWFGHLIFAAFQIKMFYLVAGFFTLLWISYISSFYFSSLEIYDYTTVTYNLFVWVFFLFLSNNVFTFIFFIELLSSIILLMLITSTFSSTYFYNNVSLSSTNYFQKNKPFALLQTLMFLFWISLVASLNLFLFLTLFYMKVLTFDWFLLEHILYYVWAISDLKTLFYLTLNWFNLMFCIFLKCGIAPFYFWKPTFFKGIPLHALYVYIFFFYFFLFLFIIYFLLVYMSDLFIFNILVNLASLLLGTTVLLFILYESYVLKAFFAISSILNSLLVFLAISSAPVFDVIFFF